MATTFITIPIEIMHDNNLSANQKFILSEIIQLTSLKKGCVASNKHFSELIGITTQGVSKAIHKLEKDGYIEIDNAQSKRNFGREITINSGKSAINSGKSAINSGLESKENKTNNITKYQKLIINLKEKASIPSKVTETKKGKQFFRQIKDLERFTELYLAHQKEKGEFASRVTLFMEDYISNQDKNIAVKSDMSTWEDVLL